MKTTPFLLLLSALIFITSCDLLDRNKQYFDVINDITFQDHIIGLNNVHDIPVSLEIDINGNPLLQEDNLFLTESSALDSFFTIPSYSTLTFYYDSLRNTNLACVSLGKKSKGTLNIPLKAFCVEGGEITYGNELVEPKSANSFIQNNAKIEIDNVSSDANIYYILNEDASIFVINNTLAYLATDAVNFSYKKPLPFACKVK